MSTSKNNNSSLLICPICKTTLSKFDDTNTYKCVKLHSYDIAKQGYVNLLISNQKKSNNPGESKEMIKIRRDFLDQGFYQPIADELSQQVNQLSRNPVKTILDLGCGEGYYLNQLLLLLNHDAPTPPKNSIDFYGLDISKEALKLASNRKIDVTWLVASNFHTPFKDNSLDIILSVFSPISDEEINRILSKEGHFIRILPNANHLIELRELIYDTIEERREGTINPIGLNCIHESKVSYPITLGQKNLTSLLKMTPHYWKTSIQNQQKVNDLESLTITVDMNISVFAK